MPSKRVRAIRVAWRFLLLAVALSAVLMHLWIREALPWPGRAFELKETRKTGGFASMMKLPQPWPGFVFIPQSATLTEDGRAMTRANENGLVREKGMGAFRVGESRVLFSASDGSDPETNGRKYTLALRTAVSPKIRPWITAAGVIAALLLLGGNFVALARSMRRSAVLFVECAGSLPPPSARKWALALFAGALAVRAGFLWLNPEYTDRQMSIAGVPYSDARDWNAMARSTALGRGVDSTSPGMRPLYPIFLAHLYTWCGDSLILAKALQALIGAGSAALIFLALRRAMPLWAALAAALFFAVDPREVTQAGKLMTEPFGTLLILLSVWCLMIGGERRRPAMLFASGAFFACSNLARPLTLFAFPLFAGLVALKAWLRGTRRWRAAMLHSAAFAFGTAICLAPWIARQRAVHGIWGISANTASALFAASTPEFGVWEARVEALPAEAGIPRGIKERDEFFQMRFRENLRKHPGFYASNVAHRLRNAALASNNVSPALRWAGLGAFCILMALALLRADPRSTPALTLPFVVALPALAFANEPWASALAFAGVVFALWWRWFPAAVLVVTHFGALLGSALFANPDLPRMRLLIDWLEAGWMFAGLLAIASLAVSLLLRIPFRSVAGLPCAAERNPVDENAPRWLRGIGWGFAAFLIVSASRLVVLNCFTAPAAKPHWDLTDADRTALLNQLVSRDPTWQRIADPALMQATRGWARTVFVEPGWLEPEVYRLPAGFGFEHWTGLFAPRSHEHTCFTFRGPGRSFAARVWVEFAGDIPPAVRSEPCILIGLAKVRPTVTAYFENSVEAVAIVPAPDLKPDIARIISAPEVPETRALLDAAGKLPQ